MATLAVYNGLGQKVTSLINEMQDAGYHKVKFDASELASGAYFYRIEAENLEATKTLLLLR